MRKSAAITVPCALTLLTGLAAAQTPPAAPSGPTIRTTTNEVLLDLVVRDKHGKPVKNLKPGDVEVYEDGVKQDLRSFRFIATHETAQTQKPGAAGSVSISAVPAGARPLRAVNLVCIVFHNLDPVSRGKAIDAVREFLKNEWQPETYVGLFNLDDRLTPIYPFTKNRAEIAQAAQNAFSLRPVDFAQASEQVLTANPNVFTITTVVDMAAHTAVTTARVTGGELSRDVITTADVSTGSGAAAQRGAQATERRDFSHLIGRRELDKMENMVAQLGPLPGRKSVLLVSTGLITPGDPDLFDALLAKANKAGMTVYALDVAGLDASTAKAADVGLGRVASVSQTQSTASQIGDTSALTVMKEKSRQGDTMNDAVRSSDTQAHLRALAESTGGFLIANTNEYRKPFQRIFDDLDAHYEATYRPTSDKYDGRLRKIEVKLARAEWHVESRTGYFAMPDLKGAAPLLPFETIGLALLNANPVPHAFEFRTGAFHFQNDGTTATGSLVFDIPGSALTPTPHPERQLAEMHPSLLALVKDKSGNVVDKYSLDTPYQVPDANVAAVRASSVTYTHPVTLPPGEYKVEAVVMDREGGRSSVGTFAFSTGEARKGVGLSSMILIRSIEPATGEADASDPLVYRGKRLVPLVNTALNADAKPYLYFVVYPDKSNAEKPKLQVEFRVDGKVVANQEAALPAPDASGGIPMMIRAATHPGNCELKITAVQGSQSATETTAYTVAK